MTAPSDDPEAIKLTIPAEAIYAQLARLTAASISARYDFSYDDVEDVRIAVGELCGLLVDDEPTRIEFAYRFGDDTLDISAQRLPAGEPVTVGPLSHQILDAVTDEIDVHDHGTGLTIRKHRRG